MYQLEDEKDSGTAPQETDQKIAVNPNLRANVNVTHTPFDKVTENDSKGNEGSVGTEITDGEAG